MSTYTPQIYVACLAAYNSGYLHGAWIDATLGEKHIQEAIQDILRTSPTPNAEEWAIHDSEDFVRLPTPHPDISTIADTANFIAEHQGLGEHPKLGCQH